MTELEINKLNESIDYEDGKLYWKMGHNYSSKLWDTLKTKGWRAETVRNFVKIYDNENNIIVNTIFWEQSLKELAIKMR